MGKHLERQTPAVLEGVSNKLPDGLKEAIGNRQSLMTVLKSVKVPLVA
jgi:hypothetical protein